MPQALTSTTLPHRLNMKVVKQGKGGFSATNIMDLYRALGVLRFFPEPSVVVMKHAIPSGLATFSGFATECDGKGLDGIYIDARDTDARSAFGSVVTLNVPLGKATAEAIMSTHVEIVEAPDYEEGTISILKRKKEIRAVTYSNLEELPKFLGDNIEGLYDFKSLPGGVVIVQPPYLTNIRGPEDLILDAMVTKDGKDYVIENDPTPQQLKDLLTSWYVNIGVRSNGIVIVKDGVTLAVGSGQQERIGAVEQAIVKAIQKEADRAGKPYNSLMGIRGIESTLGYRPLEGASVSSDAFFPFSDSIEALGNKGVKAVIQPGGSARDHESIEAANKYRMAMVFPEEIERCFGHF